VKFIPYILKEEQKFDFDSNKSQIIGYINKILKGEKLNSVDNPFYNIIVGNPKVGAAEKIGFTRDIKAKWKDYFSDKMFNTDGVWSQRDFGSAFKKETGDGKTYNYYITIKKDPGNIMLYWKSLGDLDKKLKNFSDTEQTPIKYKTHRLLDAFVDHNDSLKVYYYNPNYKKNIEDIVKEWVSSNGINQSNRTHNHGVDIKGENGGSYGQILANKVGEIIKQTIDKYKNKYTAEQYYEWIKKHMADIIKNIKII
jgi:hypothetical protein